MLARKSLLLFATHLVNSLLGFASTFIVARLMGPEILGIIGYLLGLAGLVALFSDLGFSVAHVKRVSEQDDVAENIGAFFVLKGGLTVIVTLVLYLAPVVADWVGYRPLTTPEHYLAYYLLASIYLFRGLGTLFNATFRARQETAKTSVSLIVSSFATAVAKIAVAVAGLGLVALSSTYLLESAVLFGVALLLFRGYPVKRPRWAHLRRYVIFALPVMLTFVLANLIANIDRVMLGEFWDVTEVGYYLGVAGILRIMEQVSSAGMTLFMPQSSHDAHHGRHAIVVQRLFAAEKYLLLIMVPITVLVVFFREPIVRLVLGNRFLPSIPVLAVLAANALWKTYRRPYGNLAYALDKPHYLVWTAAVNLVTLLIADPILIPNTLFGIPMLGLGSLGAALGWLVKSLVGGSVLLLLLNRRAQVPIYGRAVWFLAAGGLMYGTMYALESVLQWNQLWHVPLLALIGGGV
ncbi:MAG TPA: flippase, partial [Anaerolineae bacterium]|nr:flippase [Anaerolineae bacterium]